MPTNDQILNLSSKERWAHFRNILQQNGISEAESPIDYPEPIRDLLVALNDQDYRESNGGAEPPKGIRDTDLFKIVAASR